MKGSLKRRIFDVIQPDRGDSAASRIFDLLITSLIILSVSTVFVVTFDLSHEVWVACAVCEVATSLVFTVEYLLRLWTADLLYPGLSGRRARLRYIVSPMAVVDLLAILPFWLPMVSASFRGMRALRLVRLLRILKLNRYFDALGSLASVIVDKKRELVGSLFFVLLLMLVSSLLMYSAEHDAQPEVFRNGFSGLWWAVATLTTVGYGDIYPVTVLGRVLGTLIALSGIAALAIPTGIITAGLTEQLGRAKETREELVRQQDKDAEHEQILREHTRLLKEIAEILSRRG